MVIVILCLCGWGGGVFGFDVLGDWGDCERYKRCVLLYVCVPYPGPCLCLGNPSYACCSNTGLSQPTAHWIWSWMNTFSILCLSVSLSHILCFSVFASLPWPQTFINHTNTHAHRHAPLFRPWIESWLGALCPTWYKGVDLHNQLFIHIIWL